MSSESKTAHQPLDLSKWRNMPMKLMAAGAVFVVIGLIFSERRLDQFAFSWLLAFMFFLSLCGGALFLVMAHHLFDAGWSVPIRRFCEHIASLFFPYLAILFAPIAIPGVAKTLYAWMRENAHYMDHALKAKQPIFTMAGFYIVAAICFFVWWFLSSRLRYWSLHQDKTGAAEPTYKMRFYSCIGIFLFALTFTLGAIMWMKAYCSVRLSKPFGKRE